MQGGLVRAARDRWRLQSCDGRAGSRGAAPVVLAEAVDQSDARGGASRGDQRAVPRVRMGHGGARGGDARRSASTADIRSTCRWSRGSADYDVMLGALEPGRHVVRARSRSGDDGGGAASATARRRRSVAVTPIVPDAAEHLALALAPFVYARPNTVGRFTDVPVFDVVRARADRARRAATAIP